MSRDLGWGWMPISWEGWLVVVANVVIILIMALNLNLSDTSPTTDVLKLVTGIAITTGIAVIISIAKCRPKD